MKIKTKQLTIEKIDNSSEIKDWISQFSFSDASVAKSLLCRLEFVSRDNYSRWLLEILKNYTNKGSCAIYAVRKFDKKIKCLWDNNGCVQPRPPQTQGSEDLVASVISNSNRQNNNFFIDHPSLDVLRENKVRHILLIDDSIGSGQRVSNFIQLMTSNKTFLSWWNGGFLTIHIISYARTCQSEQFIKKETPGSDHGKRKYRLSHKLIFDSTIVYDAFDLHNRWGNRSRRLYHCVIPIIMSKENGEKGLVMLWEIWFFTIVCPIISRGYFFIAHLLGNHYFQIEVYQTG